ncbi:MAG: hypothetical protein ABH847_00160 [Candidatus Omnitrophota bacterium]
MRRQRAKYVLILIGVALLIILAYVDFESKVFLNEFKKKAYALIKDKIGLEGEIGDIEGGIFREIILKDIVLYHSPSPQSAAYQVKELPFFSSLAIALDYKLWDIALKRYDRLNKITFISPKIYFANSETKFSVPKVVEPAWKELTVSIRDGSFYSGVNAPLISELNGSFKLNESGIESQNVNAKVLGQRFFGRGRIGFPIVGSAIQLEGAIKGKGYVLRAQVNGILGKIFMRGSFDALEKLNLNFAGNIAATEGAVAFRNFNFGRNFMLNGLLQPAKRGFALNIFPRNTASGASPLGEVSKVEITGDFSTFPYFTLNISANHLKLSGFDLLSNYNIKGKFNYGEDNRLNSIVGELATSGSIINYNPIRELKGNYEIADNKIKLKAINYDEVVLANGVISFFPSNEIDLYIKFKGAQLGGLTDLILDKGMLSGLVYGDVHIYGNLPSQVKIDGQLEFKDGNISSIKYNLSKMNLRSNGSMIEFVNSKVYTEGAVLDLEGKINIKEIATPRALRYIQLKSDPRTVVLAGVDLIKGMEGEDIAFGKDVGEQFRVNFRAYASRDLPEKSLKSDEMELEYKLGGAKSIKLKMRENEDFFGVEHKVRF